SFSTKNRQRRLQSGQQNQGRKRCRRPKVHSCSSCTTWVWPLKVMVTAECPRRPPTRIRGWFSRNSLSRHFRPERAPPEPKLATIGVKITYNTPAENYTLSRYDGATTAKTTRRRKPSSSCCCDDGF